MLFVNYYLCFRENYMKYKLYNILIFDQPVHNTHLRHLQQKQVIYIAGKIFFSYTKKKSRLIGFLAIQESTYFIFFEDARITSSERNTMVLVV